MNQPLQKHQFLLGRLLNLQVLSHSEGFKGFDLPQALQALQHWREEDLAGLSQMLKDLEGEERFNRWKLIFQETAGPLASRTPALPLTLQRVYQQELAGLDPWLYLAWMQSLVAARLLEQKFGDQDPQVKGLLDGTILGAVDWFFPALGDLEATLLAQGPGPYRLTGRTPALVGRYLELNHLKTLFLVLAKLGSPEGEKLGLFLSAVGASPLVPVRGPVGVGAVDFAQPTEEAQLLEFIDPTCSVLALAADQVLLLQSSLCTQACQAALEAGQQKRVQDLEDPKKDMALLYHPLAADQLVEIKGLAEGLNGAVLQIAFYQDCLSQAKPGQEEYFSDLLELYRTVLKVYAGKHVPQALLSAVKLTGNDLLELLDGLQISGLVGLLGGSDLDWCARFVTEVLPRNEGRAFASLFKEFEQVSRLAAKTGGLKETIGIFTDFAGGLFLLVNDLWNPEAGKSAAALVNARTLVDLFGDMILAYLLIRQAYESELWLAEQGANFFHLGQDAVQNPDLRPYHNRIVLAERFAIQHLARQEGQIRVMQRNLAPALNGLLESEGKE